MVHMPTALHVVFHVLIIHHFGYLVELSLFRLFNKTQPYQSNEISRVYKYLVFFPHIYYTLFNHKKITPHSNLSAGLISYLFNCMLMHPTIVRWRIRSAPNVALCILNLFKDIDSLAFFKRSNFFIECKVAEITT